jgi:hypothetical protein
LVKSVRKNTHIQELECSVCSIDLDLVHEWGPVLDDISQNCSLTNINLEGNNINQKFLNSMEDELSQNKLINDIIKPSII